jgi:hypothetical protein
MLPDERFLFLVSFEHFRDIVDVVSRRVRIKVEVA